MIDLTRPFTPGMTAEVGISEIEFTVAENGPNGFGNSLTFAGGSGADHWQVSTGDAPEVVFDGDVSHLFPAGNGGRDGGIDLNPDELRPDADLLWDNTDDLFFEGGDGNDTIDFRGGIGAGAAYTIGDGTVRGGSGNDTVVLQSLIQSAEGGPDDDDLTGSVLDGGDGDDTLTGVQFGGLTGGSGADVINGTDNQDTIDAGPGDDVVRAGAGNDTIELGENDDRVLPGAGNDTVRGDEGTDLVDASESPGPVTFDLAIGDAPQTTGEGSDRLIGLEGAIGSAAGDILLGNAGPDSLRGGGGDDRLVDRGGADALDGGPGADTASYAESPVPVSIDLAAKTAGAGGIDTLEGLERVEGSPFADVIAGGPGPDDIAAGAGDDLLKLRDGAADSADCGAGADTAEVDAAGDVLAACETVSFPPPPPPPPACLPAAEIPGNGADENCDGVDAPFPRVVSRLRSLFDIFLSVRDADPPAGRRPARGRHGRHPLPRTRLPVRQAHADIRERTQAPEPAQGAQAPRRAAPAQGRAPGPPARARTRREGRALQDPQGAEAPGLERAVPRARRDQTGEMLLRRAAGGLAAVIAALALPGSAAAAVSCVRRPGRRAPGHRERDGRQHDDQARARHDGRAAADQRLPVRRRHDLRTSTTVTFTAQTQNQTVTIDYSGGFLTTGTLGGGISNYTDFHRRRLRRHDIRDEGLDLQRLVRRRGGRRDRRGHRHRRAGHLRRRASASSTRRAATCPRG